MQVSPASGFAADDGTADLQTGLGALGALCESITPERAVPAILHVLASAAAKLCGWDQDRHALMLVGVSGTFKTSFSQALMTLTGPAWALDERLVRFGEGATKNALMAVAAEHVDAPFVIDNYKSNTSRGEKDFVEVIHALVEGTEKLRLTRQASLQVPKHFGCWVIVTGEDVPASDAAALARTLVIRMLPAGEGNAIALGRAQAASEHLPSVWASWLDWLESDDSNGVIASLRDQMHSRRDAWTQVLREKHPDATNPRRIASNLAVNSLCFDLATEHPQIGPVLEPFRERYQAGLMIIMDEMGQATEESLEASRLLSALREMIAMGRVHLLERQGTIPVGPDSDRVVGFYDGEGIYLTSDTAIKAARALLGDSFHLTKQQLHQQLHRLGLIVKTGSDGRPTVRVRVGAGESASQCGSSTSSALRCPPRSQTRTTKRTCSDADCSNQNTAQAACREARSEATRVSAC